MKAAVFKAPGAPLEIETLADPQPAPGELVIKVRACGICGTDLHWTEARQAPVGWRPIGPGAVLGHEFAGEVVEVGKEARGNWKVGDRVTAMPQLGCGTCGNCLDGKPHRCATALPRGSAEITGAYAEYTRVGSSVAVLMSESMSFQDGALVEPLAVGLRGVRRARTEPGDTALIIGAGPVGLAVALWCNFFGVRHIVVSDLVAARAEQSARFGATASIDASTQDVAAEFERLTGAGPKIVFDCVGVPGSLQLAIDQAPVDARVVVVGLCMHGDTIYPATALTKELDLAFVMVYTQQEFEMAADMLGRGRIDASAMVTDTVGFDTFSDTFEAMKTAGTAVKVMLEPS
jgi:(R,R)-butanediol dehydrogenase/meso-butanediol dehydrogenase/diacetyl reductase